MDLSIDLLNFKKEDLKISYKPKRIWLNFWGKGKLFTEDYANVLNIFGKFNNAEILIMNAIKETRKNLKNLFCDYSRVKVLEK